MVLLTFAHHNNEDILPFFYFINYFAFLFKENRALERLPHSPDVARRAIADWPARHRDTPLTLQRKPNSANRPHDSEHSSTPKDSQSEP